MSGVEPNEIVRFVEELRHYGFRRDRIAANMIETLQLRLEEQGMANARNAEKLINDMETWKHLYNSAKVELDESQRRERAAVEILNSIGWVGSGAKGRIEDAIGILRGPEQEGE